jgi:ribonuclease BN (tRNA processing enzyme)
VTSQLVVLGSCGAWPEPGHACSCYVVEHAGFRIVVDLGYGTLTRLLDYLRSASGEGIDAVIVTHRRADHELPRPPRRIGPFVLRSWLLPHWVPNAGVRLESPGLPLALTGDCGLDPTLRELGSNANLFVVEATDGHEQGPGARPTSHGWPQVPYDGREAREAAVQADCKRLLLTHFWPGNDRQQSVVDAHAVFAGPVVAAEEGLILRLP